MNNMLFAPSEKGLSLVEFAIVVGILALIFKGLVWIFSLVSGKDTCGVFESQNGSCL